VEVQKKVSNLNGAHIDYDNPVEIAAGIYWVGFFDPQTGLHCNPYLIIDGDEAMVIDGGSRNSKNTTAKKCG
jgi:hypothetical protein